MYSGGHKARPYKITTKHTTTSGGQYRLSSQRSIAQTTYAVVICFIHFATTPSTNLSIPLSLRLFPLPLHPLENGRGRHFADKYGISLEFCSRRSCTCVFAKCTRMYDTIPRDNTDTASSIRIARKGLCRTFGCTLRRHKCNCAWIRTLVNTVNTV